MTSPSRLPSVPVVSAYGLVLTLSTALWLRSVAAAPSLDATPTALLAGRPPVPPSVVLTGGVGLALLLAATVIGLALLTARVA